MKSNFKRIFSFVIAMVLTLTACCVNVYATADNTSDFEALYNEYENFMEREDKNIGAIKNTADSDDALQNIDAMNWLKSELRSKGIKDGSTYYLESYQTISGNAYYYSIIYNSAEDDLFFGGAFFNRTYYVFLYPDENATDGYEVGSNYYHTNYPTVYSLGTVYPQNYPHTIVFDSWDAADRDANDATLHKLLNTSFSTAGREWDKMLKNKTEVSMFDFGFVNASSPDLPESFTGNTITYFANGGSGAPARQLKDKDQYATISTTAPVRKGYKFLGWSEQYNAKTATYLPGSIYVENEDLVLYAVWELDLAQIAKVKIKNNPTITYQNYGTRLVITPEVKNAPEGSQLKWELNTGGMILDPTFEGVYVDCVAGSVLTVTLVDSNGDPIKDQNGNNISDSERIIVNSNFFLKLIAFFRNLFTGPKIVYQ